MKKQGPAALLVIRQECPFGELSGRVLDSRPKGRGFEPHQRHCVVSLSRNINPSLVLVQLRNTRPFITERLVMGREESNQTNEKKECPFLLDLAQGRQGSSVEECLTYLLMRW